MKSLHGGWDGGGNTEPEVRVGVSFVAPVYQGGSGSMSWME